MAIFGARRSSSKKTQRCGPMSPQQVRQAALEQTANDLAAMRPQRSIEAEASRTALTRKRSSFWPARGFSGFRNSKGSGDTEVLPEKVFGPLPNSTVRNSLLRLPGLRWPGRKPSLPDAPLETHEDALKVFGPLPAVQASRRSTCATCPWGHTLQEVEESAWMCDECGTMKPHGYRFGCSECSYDLCVACLDILENQGRYSRAQTEPLSQKGRFSITSWWTKGTGAVPSRKTKTCDKAVRNRASQESVIRPSIAVEPPLSRAGVASADRNGDGIADNLQTWRFPPVAQVLGASLAASEAARMKREAEEREMVRLEQQAALRREEQRQRLDDERKRLEAEAEKRRLAEEEKRNAEMELERLKKAVEEERRKAAKDAEQQRQAEEELRRVAEEDRRYKQSVEKQRLEAEARLAEEHRQQVEEERRRVERETEKRRLAEEEQRKAQAELQRLKREAEDERRRAAEEAERRKQVDEELRRTQEEKRRRRDEDERWRKMEEAEQAELQRERAEEEKRAMELEAERRRFAEREKKKAEAKIERLEQEAEEKRTESEQKAAQLQEERRRAAELAERSQQAEVELRRAEKQKSRRKEHDGNGRLGRKELISSVLQEHQQHMAMSSSASAAHNGMEKSMADWHGFASGLPVGGWAGATTVPVDVDGDGSPDTVFMGLGRTGNLGLQSFEKPSPTLLTSPSGLHPQMKKAPGALTYEALRLLP